MRWFAEHQPVTPIVNTIRNLYAEQPEIYLDLVEVAEWEPDDPRLPAFADHLVSLIDETSKNWEDYEGADEFELDDGLVDLLDSVFLNALPVAPTLLKLLEERGWTGWTRLERIDPAPKRAGEP